MNYASVFQKIFAENYFTRSVRKNNANFSCKYGKLYLPLPTETITTKAMRTLTKEQTYHFILTYHTSTLIYWYNNVICEPYGDYSEQVIRNYDENQENDLKDVLSLETLMSVGKNPNTKISGDDLYFCLTGGEKPYLISFSSFEQFMKRMTEEDREGFLNYLCEYPENLESLDEIAQNGIK